MHESICFILHNFEKNTCGHSRLKLCKEKLYLNSQINCLKSWLKIAPSSHNKNVRTNSEAKGKLINTEGIQESECCWIRWTLIFLPTQRKYNSKRKYSDLNVSNINKTAILFSTYSFGIKFLPHASFNATWVSGQCQTRGWIIQICLEWKLPFPKKSFWNILLSCNLWV